LSSLEILEFALAGMVLAVDQRKARRAAHKRQNGGPPFKIYGSDDGSESQFH
jgi:hypothetical protein